MKSTWKLELPQLLVLALMFGLAAWTCVHHAALVVDVDLTGRVHLGSTIDARDHDVGDEASAHCPIVHAVQSERRALARFFWSFLALWVRRSAAARCSFADW